MMSINPLGKYESMKEQFVTYDIALKLKVLGFDEECLARYLVVTEWEKPTGEIRLQISNNCTNTHNALFKAPLWQQVIDWFRIKYNWLIVVDVASSNEYYVAVREFDEYGTIISKIPYKTYSIYDEAREQAILKAIELCKK